MTPKLRKMLSEAQGTPTTHDPVDGEDLDQRARKAAGLGYFGDLHNGGLVNDTLPEDRPRPGAGFVYAAIAGLTFWAVVGVAAWIFG